MLKTNEDRVVQFLVQCQPGPPKTRARWGVDHQGTPFILPLIGGITLNVAAGDPAFGDYDIMTSDPDTVKEYKLHKLRFGDFVALMDHDNRYYGRAYRKGVVTIGIVVHNDCLRAGYGPCVTPP